MRKLLVALSATFVVLVVTGLYQAFRYRPTAASVWGTQGIALDDYQRTCGCTSPCGRR